MRTVAKPVGLNRMVYVSKFVAAVVFCAILFFVLVIALELIPVGEAVQDAMLLAAVGANSVICIRAPSGRLAWSGCSRLVGGGTCLLSLAIVGYVIFVVATGTLKRGSGEFGEQLGHLFLMLTGVHFLAAVAGFVAGACLFGLGQALKTSVPRKTSIDPGRP